VILLDANVLVYGADCASPRHGPCRDVIQRTLAGHVDGVLVPQVLLEFYVTVTGSRVRAPLAPAVAWRQIDALASALPVMDVRRDSLDLLGKLITQVGLGGHRVFDLFLAAQMRSHGVSEICTDNARDFHNLGVTPLTPEDILARALETSVLDSDLELADEESSSAGGES
jgi:predicted nucleic acid-binding protein